MHYDHLRNTYLGYTYGEFDMSAYIVSVRPRWFLSRRIQRKGTPSTFAGRSWDARIIDRKWKGHYRGVVTQGVFDRTRNVGQVFSEQEKLSLAPKETRKSV
jgi:hypothetical protein